MSNQLTPIGQICQAIDKMEGSLNENLQGTGIAVGRFLATAKTAIQTHTDKDRLASADRSSLYLAIKKAAGDGLMPDNREAALVVYGNQVQYQPMVQGLVKLARQSGEIESIGAYIVYDQDEFIYRVGIDAIPQHQAGGENGWFSSKRGEPIGVWAYVKLKTGDYLEPVMLTKDRIDRIAKRSKIAKNYDPKQGLDWEEFWKKAAIRNILKYAPKSTQLERAMDKMDDEFNMAQDDVYLNSEPTAAPETKKQTRAAKVIVEENQQEPEIIDVESVKVIEDDEVPL